MGNVLAVFTDKRIKECVSDTVVYYKADVVNAFDYYPFGAPMPERGWSPSTCSNGVQVITFELDAGTECFSLTLANDSGEFTGEYCLTGAGSVNNIVATFEEGLDSIVSYYNKVHGLLAYRSGNKVTIEANLCMIAYFSEVSPNTPDTNDILSLTNTKVHKYDDNYRFGFNGMEKTNEVYGDGNEYTTEYRQFDVRLGKWLSLDPLMNKFPWQSPYNAFDNNPISLTDPYGLSTNSNPLILKEQKQAKKITDAVTTIVPLTTFRLREMAKSAGATGSGINFNRQAGKMFEDVALQSQGLVENTTSFNSNERRVATGGTSSRVIPDGVRSVIGHELKWNFKYIRKEYPNSSFFEAKAVNGFISLRSSNYQIQGELDAVRNSPAGRVGRGVMTFVTTANTLIAPHVVDYATRNRILLYQVVAFENTEDNSIRFSPPIPLNDRKSINITPIVNMFDLKTPYFLNSANTAEPATTQDPEEVE